MLNFSLAASSRLRHRGPDWSGIDVIDNNYLAHERLAIVDPASGHQPLYNEDKSIIVTVSILPLPLFSLASSFG